MRRIAPAVAALALLLPACTERPDPNDGVASAQSAGGSPAATCTEPSEGGETDPVKWAKCLRDQGIPAEDPEPGGEKPRIPESVPQERIDAAMQQCEQFAPNYGKAAPPLDPAQLENLRKFARCMREQGIDSFPDPGPTGFPRPQAPPQDRSKLRQQAEAMKVCSQKVPEAGISVDPETSPKIEVPGQ